MIRSGDFDASLWRFRARLVRVIDGDTVVVETDSGFNGRMQVHVRLQGVFAPELDEPGGPEAKARLESLVAGDGWNLRLETTRLKNGSEATSFARYVGRLWVVQPDGTLLDVAA